MELHVRAKQEKIRQRRFEDYKNELITRQEMSLGYYLLALTEKAFGFSGTTNESIEDLVSRLLEVAKIVFLRFLTRIEQYCILKDDSKLFKPHESWIQKISRQFSAQVPPI